MKDLRAYIVEETYEVIDAIDREDPQALSEELGDLLYIIVMLAEINRDLGHFDLTDVLTQINDKLIRRHPHVFAGTFYENEQQLADQWNAIKAAEKKKNSV